MAGLVEVVKVDASGPKLTQVPCQKSGSASRTVVLPVDGSAEAEAALQWAAENVLRRGDVAFVVSALPVHEHTVLSDGAYEGDVVSWQETVRRRKDECEARLREGKTFVDRGATRLQAALRASGGRDLGVTIRPVVLDACETIRTPYGGNSPGKSIARFAACERANLIVMTSRGLGCAQKLALSAAGLGSVSDEVTKRAACPTTIVRLARS